MRQLLAIVLLVLLAACETKPQTTAGFGQEMPLQPKQGDLTEGTLVYRSPNIDPHKYRGIYIAPTVIYDGADAEWGGTDADTRQRVAARLTSDFQNALRARGRSVLATPADTSVTLQLTLASITSTYGVVATAVKLTPIGFGISVLKSAAGLPASFTGSITVGGKLTESRTGALLGGFVGRRSPLALDPRTLGGTEDTALLAASRAADDFAAAMDRVQREGN